MRIITRPPYAVRTRGSGRRLARRTPQRLATLNRHLKGILKWFTCNGDTKGSLQAMRAVTDGFAEGADVRNRWYREGS
jgi:hypothetical protein